MEQGTVCGVEQNAHGFFKGKKVITYNRGYYVSPNREEDGLEVGFFYSIEGEPGVEASLTGGILTDIYLSTAARAVNSTPQVVAAPPGLLTVYELPTSPCLP